MSETFPVPVLLLAGPGLVLTFRRYWHELLFAYAVILSTVGEVLVFYGNARFRSPIEPLLILLATGALWWITQPEPGTLRWELSKSARVTSAHTSDKQKPGRSNGYASSKQE